MENWTQDCSKFSSQQRSLTAGRSSRELTEFRSPRHQIAVNSLVTMKEFYISDCVRFENQVVTTSFVVVSKQAKPKKSGELYLALTLADRTGHLDAKMWDNVAEHINCFEQDDFVKVRGLLNRFNGRFQLTVHKVRSMQDSEVDFDDYLPRTTKDIGALWQELCACVETFRDPHLKALIQAFMADPQI